MPASCAVWRRRTAGPRVVLDRTAFYPTSGGQPFDTGTLGTARVLDVSRAGRRRRSCTSSTAPIAAGAGARARRLGAPLRSHAAAHRPARAVGGVRSRARRADRQLPPRRRRVDDRSRPRGVAADEAAAAEDEANRIVWEDRPVTIRFADAAEAARLPLRKESAREGTLRLIDVADFDLSACGGTHVARTGAIGIIAIAGIGALRGGTRVEFVCGGRALRSPSPLRDIVAASGSCCRWRPHELPASIERLQAEAKELRRQIKDLQTRLAGHEAAALAAGADSIGPSSARRSQSLEGWDAQGLKQSPAAIAARPGHVAILLSVTGAVIARRRPFRGRRVRRRSGAEADGRAVRRQGWRPSRAGAGRRTDRLA